MSVCCIEVRKQLSNLRGLASERKEVKGVVISLLEFFLWGRSFIGFTGWWGCLRITRVGPFSASAGGRGQVGFELVIRHMFLHLLCFLRSKQHIFFEPWLRILIVYIFLLCVLYVLVIWCQDGFSNNFGCFSQRFVWVLAFPTQKPSIIPHLKRRLLFTAFCGLAPPHPHLHYSNTFHRLL